MTITRALAERLSRGIVLRRRLPERFGGQTLFVSPDASLRFWRPGLEHVDPELLQLAQELVHAGESVWDIGANVGLFAFAAAHRAGPSGRVIAVEADPQLAKLLRRSVAVARNGHATIHVRHAAISDEVGMATFAIAARGRATSHLVGVAGSTQTGGVRSYAQIPSHTLDALLAEEGPPTFLKIDVEGAEHLALRGASTLLAQIRPRLLVEVSNYNRGEIAHLLGKLEYSMYDAFVPPNNRRPLEQPAWNTIAIPRERSAEG